jgi:hypothetical protein
MKAVVFLSLFLGLTAGLQRVEVAVDETRVDRVELRLDGETAVALSGRPWAAGVDLGAELAPHRLTAVGFDAAGREVERAEQWVNLPRSEAELELLLVHEAGRVAAARLAWDSLAFASPSELKASLDDAPLPVDDPSRIPLPSYDAETFHVLSAEAVFPNGATARADVAFGGPYGEETSTALTAVALEVERRRQLRRPEDAAGWLAVDGREVPVRALDRDTVDVFAVVDRAAQPHLHALGVDLERRAAGTSRPGRDRALLSGVSAPSPRALIPWNSPLLATGLLPDDRLFLVAPRVDPSRSGYLLFGVSKPVGGERGGLVWLLTRLRLESAGDGGPQRLADAVATTGLRAAAGGRPRGVVLVLGPGGDDASFFDARRAARYLELLHVPLRIWYVEIPEVTLKWLQTDYYQAATLAQEAVEQGRPVPEVPPIPTLESVREARQRRLRLVRQTWGPEVVDVDGLTPWVEAARSVREDLGRQRILWIDGVHPPSEVELAGAPAGVRLAGGP